MGPSWGPSWIPLGPSWDHLGGLRGRRQPSEARKGAEAKNTPTQFWPLGALLGVLLEASWGFLEASWAALRPFWPSLMASWTVLEAILDCLGPAWKPSWATLAMLGVDCFDSLSARVRTSVAGEVGWRQVGTFWKGLTVSCSSALQACLRYFNRGRRIQ